MLRVPLFTVLLFAVFASSWVFAQSGEDLEDWQKKLLKAMEASERDTRRADDRRDYRQDQSSDRGAARAAEKARQRHGGKVLAVVKTGDVYRVRLLGKDGRVTTVTVRD